MRRLLLSPFGRRILPPLVLFALLLVAYWAYSLHTTRPGERRDNWLVTVLTAMFLVSAVYLTVRTRDWRPQLLGIVALMLGDLVLYGSILANYRGWTEISAERRGDMLRACVTVGGLLYVFGICYYEWVRWKHPNGNDQPPNDPNIVYDRRSGKDRRQGWGKRGDP